MCYEKQLYVFSQCKGCLTTEMKEAQAIRYLETF